MSDNSRIEWTDATWGPTVGCTKVSPGCDNCYAETFVNRFAGRSAAFPNPFDVVTLRPQFLDRPLRWARPRHIFVNSLSDLFHADVPDGYIARVFAVMALTPRHTYQVLTKRHARMRALLSDEDFRSQVSGEIVGLAVEDGHDDSHLSGEGRSWRDWWPLDNVWLGVSVENQQWADIRIPALLDTPAAIRFLSCEPLLGPVSLAGAVDGTCWWCRGTGTLPGNNAPVQGFSAPNCWHCNGQGLDGRHVDWVIVGGESGPGARSMDPDWARTIRNQCEATGTAFHFKQWGQHDEHGQRHRSKHDAGRELDGRTHDDMPTVAVPA